LAVLTGLAWFIATRCNALEPGTPVKVALGIAQAGLGFGALVLAYLLHTTGELCLSPVGLSAVTKLSVPGVVGVMMGAWFLATAYSEFVAAQLAKLAAIDTVSGQVTDIATALASYTTLFNNLLYLGLGVAVLLLFVSPILKKMMHGIH
jgi:POT family proton-dependent oligopeptide transporter